VDIHALRKRGWSISAIARHVGRDRKTVKAYLHGKREVGIRAPAGDDAFAAYLTYSTGPAGRGSASMGDRVVRRGDRTGV